MPPDQDQTPLAASPFHPLATLFPAMTEDEFRVLVADIRDRGQQDPILLFNGQVADGRHRWNACEELGIVPRTETWAGSEADLEQHVISKNLVRRHLKPRERAVLAARFARMPWGTNRHTLNVAPSTSLRQKDAAAIFATSADSIQRIHFIQENGIAALYDAVTADKIPLRRGREIAALTAAEQVIAVADCFSAPERRRIKAAHSVIRKAESHDRRLRTQQSIDAQRREPGTLPQGNAAIAIIDPPWDYANKDLSSHCNPGFHYDLMSIAAIAALPVAPVLHRDALVLIWTTSMHLADCIGTILPAWGLAYMATAVWKKPKAVVGAGILRQFSEFLVIARRGKGIGQPVHQLPSVFEAPQGRHSAKPALVHEWLEQAFPEITARIEVFARAPRPGWIAWGNDAGADDSGIGDCHPSETTA